MNNDNEIILQSLNGESLKLIVGGESPNGDNGEGGSGNDNKPIDWNLVSGCNGCDRAGANSICPSMGGW